jgi:hypothetical protein
MERENKEVRGLGLVMNSRTSNRSKLYLPTARVCWVNIFPEKMEPPVAKFL